MPHLLLDMDLTFFDHVYMGEKVSNYLWFAGIILGTILLKRPMAMLLSLVSTRVAAHYSYVKHKEAIGSMLFKPMERLLQVILYFVAINQLSNTLDQLVIHHNLGQKGSINIRLGDVIDHVFLFLFIVFLTQVIIRFIDFIYYLRMGRAESDKDHARLQLLPLIKEMSKLLLWILCGFCILGNVFHVNVPALITGLGIGGIAIALAGKETVENFFAAFTILADKPFQTGEMIKFGDVNGLGNIEGKVERIGFRSTRVRSTDGATYIIPNQNLVRQNLINLSLRDSNNIKVHANVKYGITHDALQQLITKIKAALLQIHPVKEPVEIAIETFDTETLQLVISCHLPHPLPSETKLDALKLEINMKIFEVISSNKATDPPAGSR